MITRKILEVLHSEYTDKANNDPEYAAGFLGGAEVIERLLDNLPSIEPVLKLEVVRNMVISELHNIERNGQTELDKNYFHPVVSRMFISGIHNAIVSVSRASTFAKLDTLVRSIWNLSLQEWLDSVPWVRPDSG